MTGHEANAERKRLIAEVVRQMPPLRCEVDGCPVAGNDIEMGSIWPFGTRQDANEHGHYYWPEDAFVICQAHWDAWHTCGGDLHPYPFDGAERNALIDAWGWRQFAWR